ncbi:MAG: hypothetical protein AAGI38_08355 [Bacteroidota bacterium]
MNEETKPKLPPHEVKLKRGENLIEKLYQQLDQKDKIIADQHKRSFDTSLIAAFLFFIIICACLNKLDLFF